jgi:hypothetical protein
MPSNIGVLIVEKLGNVKPLCVKTYIESELYKRCGFKTADNFQKRCDWRVASGDLTYIVSAYGKDVGRASFENKYDFPPPIDNILFFGSCVLVLHTEYKGETGAPILESMDIDLWTKLYERLFGGFDDLAACTAEDENEVDELAQIPDHEKTEVGGYLKDGFVIDDDVPSVQGSDTTETEIDDESDESELLEEEYLLESD